MPHETDLPCADCGSALEERTASLSHLTNATVSSGTVDIAICPHCEAIYYPENTLLELASEPRSRGGS